MSLDFSLKCKECEQECFTDNITHNLVEMAREADIYFALWKPEEIQAKEGKDIISILERGLVTLKGAPSYFSQFDSSNGYGVYRDFIPFVEEVLEGCKKYPNATISVSR